MKKIIAVIVTIALVLGQWVADQVETLVSPKNRLDRLRNAKRVAEFLATLFTLEWGAAAFALLTGTGADQVNLVGFALTAPLTVGLWVAVYAFAKEVEKERLDNVQWRYWTAPKTRTAGL